MKQRIALSWSSGKDSSLALYELRRSGAYDIRCLLTTVTEDYQRVSMHGVREDVLRGQAAAVGLPLTIIRIPRECSNETYEERLRDGLARLKDEGVTAVAFGDIFLEDVRRYREEKNALAGLESLFPLWGRSTADIVDDFLRLGFKALTTCIDGAKLAERFLGRTLDRDFFAELPPGVDPCGENGEFHTFAFGGPVFSHDLDVALGERVRRGQFAFCDVLLRQDIGGASQGILQRDR